MEFPRFPKFLIIFSILINAPPPPHLQVSWADTVQYVSTILINIKQGFEGRDRL